MHSSSSSLSYCDHAKSGNAAATPPGAAAAPQIAGRTSGWARSVDRQKKLYLSAAESGKFSRCSREVISGDRHAGVLQLVICEMKLRFLPSNSATPNAGTCPAGRSSRTCLKIDCACNPRLELSPTARRHCFFTPNALFRGVAPISSDAAVLTSASRLVRPTRPAQTNVPAARKRNRDH